MFSSNLEPLIRSALAREEQEDELDHPVSPSPRFSALPSEVVLLARLPPLSRIESDAKLVANKSSKEELNRRRFSLSSAASTPSAPETSTASDAVHVQGEIGPSRSSLPDSKSRAGKAPAVKDIQPYEILRAIE
jgi:hypothetical protein